MSSEYPTPKEMRRANDRVVKVGLALVWLFLAGIIVTDWMFGWA